MSGYRRPRLSVGAYLGEKTAPYVVPWLLTLAAMPVAVLIHFTIGNDGQWMTILGAIFTLMTLGTWLTWKNRRTETRVTATVLVGAGLGWIALAGAGVPWSGDLLKAWVVGGVSGSLFWSIRHAGITAGHDKDTSGQDKGHWLADRISVFKNSRTDKSSVRETPDELRWRTKLDAPVTASDAQRTREQIAAVSGVGADQVKVIKVPGDESQVDIAMTRRTDNSRPLKYRGPSLPGQSIAAAPIWIGRRTDGSDIEWWITGSSDPDNPRPVAHTKCTGMTGSGKTETICTAILDMRWRTDIVPVVADPAKFTQSFGDIEDVLGFSARDEEETKQLIRNLPEVVKYRARLLGSLTRSDGGTGYKQWEPECYMHHGIPFVFLDIEEAADVVMFTDDELDEAVRKLRSVGVHLCISMQTMPHDNIPRKTRGQFAQSLAHGQSEYQDAKYALSTASLEAGADPTKWKNNAPGSLYAETVGTDEAHWPVDGRAVYMTLAEKQMSKEGSRQYWAELDEGTYERLAFGITEAPIVDADEDADLEEYEEETTVEGAGDVDVNQPLTPPPAALNVSFSDAPEPGNRMSTEEARRRLQNRLDVLEGSGVRQVRFADLADLPTEVGRGRGWVYDNLNLLVQAGRLREIRPPSGGVIYEIIERYPEAG